MRKMILVAVLAVMCTGIQSQAAIGKKDSVLIFRPSPGMNDSTDMGTANAGMDAIVSEGAPATNYANYQAVYTSPISNCNATHITSFMRFDLGSLPDTVDSVFVVFKHVDQTTYCISNCVADFYFYPVTQPWYESAITYANQPTVDTAFYGPINISFPNTFGVKEYNITKMYRLWRDSLVPNYGMQIMSPTVGCNNACIAFVAYNSDDPDSTKRPYLKIYYKADTGTIDTPVSVKQVGAGKSSLKIFPNPAHNETNMELTADNAGTGWYLITDITGRVMRREELEWNAGKNTITVPLDNLGQGMYYYILYTPEGKLTGKILKQ